jgi:hypothetical protein
MKELGKQLECVICTNKCVQHSYKLWALRGNMGEVLEFIELKPHKPRIYCSFFQRRCWDLCVFTTKCKRTEISTFWYSSAYFLQVASGWLAMKPKHVALAQNNTVFINTVGLGWCATESDPYIVNTPTFLISLFKQICANFNSKKWAHFKVLNSDVHILWTIWIMNIKSVEDGNLLNKNTNCKKISLESTVA